MKSGKEKGVSRMSIDLNFWKYKNGTYINDHEIYLKACCAGEKMSILEKLPIEEILEKVAVIFSEWECKDKHNYKKKAEGDSFCIFVTSQIVRFDCYSMSSDDINLLIDIMLEFDCPLYDPQILKRFD